MESKNPDRRHLEIIHALLKNNFEKYGTIENPTTAGFVEIIRQGKSIWNTWRTQHPNIPIEMRGTVFEESECDFSDFKFNTEFPSHIDFSGCHFKGEAKFDRAIIGESVDFSGSSFFSTCSFEMTKFNILEKISNETDQIKLEQEVKKPYFPNSNELIINFCGSTFYKKLNFHENVFGSEVVFTDAFLGSDCNLSKVTFKEKFIAKPNDRRRLAEKISFEFVKFESKAEFSGTEIKRCNFQNVIFGPLDFDDCFLGRSNFIDCDFRGDAYFSGSSFQEEIDFKNCNFYEKMSIEGKKEKGESFEEISFLGASFHGPANFANREFRKKTSFSSLEIQINGEPTLKSSKAINNFRDRLISLFEKIAGIAKNTYGSKFFQKIFKYDNKSTNIEENIFGETIEPSPIGIVREIAKWLVWIIEPKSKTKFTEFHSVVEFHGSKIHQDTNFDYVLFHAPPSSQAARAYRTLKLAMEQLKATREEQKFFRLEMKAEHSELKCGRRLMSTFYSLFSDYGFSLWRPPFWSLILFLSFGVGYYTLADACAVNAQCIDLKTAEAAHVATDPDRISAVIKYTLGSVSPAPGLDKMQTELRAPLFGHQGWISIAALVLEIVHKITTLVMTFLFALALRNLFKMKS